MNSKFETQSFIESLYYHNQDIEFEICLVHDDRVNDGAGELFAEMQKKHKTLKVITSTKQDAINYIEKLLTYYKNNNRFGPKFLDFLTANLEGYKNDTLYDTSRNILWLPSAWQYNKAVAASSGDTLVISPADYAYLFRLKELQNFVNNNAHDGYLYSKPNGLRRTLANSPFNEVQEFVNKWKGQTDLLISDYGSYLRNYKYYPSTPDMLSIPEHKIGEVIKFSDPNFFAKMQNVCNTDPHLAISVHGLHIMTRKTYNHIGGFSEEWYSRAHGDDKMSALGGKTPKRCLPAPKHFSFLWTPRTTLDVPIHTIKNIDPWIEKYPIQASNTYQVYLDHGLLDFIAQHGEAGLGNGSFYKPDRRIDQNKMFPTTSPTVRIF